ncbi:MAG TPA: outer membrane beta-barrel protein [Longimicrobiaceae bacterium]|nr:outer membrane beta-barrel protein [Longimicrobiaceae bacterium]
MKQALLTAAVLAAFAAPAAAQAPRITVEPYVGYGFFGTLPGTDSPRLEPDLAIGGRAAFQLTPQWAVFANGQRATPQIENTTTSVNVDHWAAGVEFSYVPRGGAEGMLPIMIEAGLGQARYGAVGGGTSTSDLAVKLGVASALRLTPNIGIRYGVDDYISNYGPNDAGVANQIFARVGAEIRF